MGGWDGDVGWDGDCSSSGGVSNGEQQQQHSSGGGGGGGGGGSGGMIGVRELACVRFEMAFFMTTASFLRGWERREW